ncbi:MAG: hypothetical protein JSW27_05990 [Phycisphaerales bacterium]|nr:MAG: hypothetical protein JSW27_05990 [Phycisphaerales bacterium]
MARECRSWWRNCAVEADEEILEIDALEDRVGPIDANTTRIRELISCLELCHHKAERWVESIIEAIGTGETQKGLGTRPPGQTHPAETVWQNACAALSAWCAGCPPGSLELTVGTVAAPQLLAGLGERSPLKEWQVQRVVERIRSLIGWPQSDSDPATAYVWLLFSEDASESPYRKRCPPRYQEHEEYWLATARTLLHDTDNGKARELSLGLAIDMLWPCHWRFVENLQIVLEAIGGGLHLKRPYAACGRNIRLVPNGARMETVCRTLRRFGRTGGGDGEIDEAILDQFGEVTNTKRWLALSLEKTIRLQLNPSAEMEALCALEGPAWIKE